MPSPEIPTPFRRPSVALQRALRTALRGDTPGAADGEPVIAALLRRYECGGWLHVRRAEPGSAPLPEPWRSAASQAHRQTLVDSLAALGVLREVLGLFEAAGLPAMVLKGASYLQEIYDDPGERALTDVDLLIRPADAERAATLLAAAGFGLVRSIYSPDVGETRRFEMARPGPAPVTVEIHWRLGSRGRVRFDQQGLWDRSLPANLQGVGCRRLAPSDALVYHAWHAADSYFGPTLKWALDLDAMFRRWRPDPEALVAAARSAGALVALHLLAMQVEALLPGSTPPGLIERSRPGSLRRFALGRWLAGEPLEFLAHPPGGGGRPFLRPFLIDAPSDALKTGLAVLGRPWSRRRGPPASRPWEAATEGS